MLMLILMTLILMQGHNGSTKAKNKFCRLPATKQTNSIACYNGRPFCYVTLTLACPTCLMFDLQVVFSCNNWVCGKQSTHSCYIASFDPKHGDQDLRLRCKKQEVLCALTKLRFFSDLKKGFLVFHFRETKDEFQSASKSIMWLKDDTITNNSCDRQPKIIWRNAKFHVINVFCRSV